MGFDGPQAATRRRFQSHDHSRRGRFWTSGGVDIVCGYAKDQFGARSGDDKIFGSRFSVRQIMRRLLCRLCAIAMVMLIGMDANASEREYGVGFTRLSTADPMGGQMQYSLWYPTKVPNGVVRSGPFEFPGTRDAEPAAGPFGLVILSHGSGGFDLGHRDTAIALAKAGFIAAAPLHPRNNFRDDIGDDQRIVLDGRPRQLSAVIDALLAQPAWSSRIDSEKIAAFGFSAGGYTVLAVLGAQPQLIGTRLLFDRVNQHRRLPSFHSLFWQGSYPNVGSTADGFGTLVVGEMRNCLDCFDLNLAFRAL